MATLPVAGLGYEGNGMKSQLYYRLRLLFRFIWNRLPGRFRFLLLYLGAPKVTMGVCAVIRDPAGRLLLVRHTHAHRGWDLPGGLIKAHEQPAVAIGRELREELGLKATVGAILHVENTTERRHLTIFYRVAVEGTPQHNVETDAHRYVSYEELAEVMGPDAATWIRTHLLSPANGGIPSPARCDG